MGLLLSSSHLHGENNSPQSAFYTDRLQINLFTPRRLCCNFLTCYYSNAETSDNFKYQ